MHDSRRAAHSLETWVVNRTSAISNLAETAASISPQQMQPYQMIIERNMAGSITARNIEGGDIRVFIEVGKDKTFCVSIKNIIKPDNRILQENEMNQTITATNAVRPVG